jgi:hypothetical protein
MLPQSHYEKNGAELVARKSTLRISCPTSAARYQSMKMFFLLTCIALHCEALHTFGMSPNNFPRIHRHTGHPASIQYNRIRRPPTVCPALINEVPRRAVSMCMILRGGTSSILGGALGFLAVVPPAALASAAAVGILLGLLGGGGSILAVPIFLVVLGHPPKVLLRSAPPSCATDHFPPAFRPRMAPHNVLLTIERSPAFRRGSPSARRRAHSPPARATAVGSIGDRREGGRGEGGRERHGRGRAGG